MNLKHARTVKKMTQAALAEKVGVTVRSIMRYEAENRLPQNRLSRERYCRILGIKAR